MHLSGHSQFLSHMTFSNVLDLLCEDCRGNVQDRCNKRKGKREEKTGKPEASPRDNSYSNIFRRTQTRWVIWPSSSVTSQRHCNLIMRPPTSPTCKETSKSWFLEICVAAGVEEKTRKPGPGIVQSESSLKRERQPQRSLLPLPPYPRRRWRRQRLLLLLLFLFLLVLLLLLLLSVLLLLLLPTTYYLLPTTTTTTTTMLAFEVQVPRSERPCWTSFL